MYQEFIEQMYKVFSDVEKPLIDDITPHRCIECDDIRDQVHPYNKRDLTDALLKYHGDALPLLSAEALRYYFPRYIEFGLLNQDSNVFDNCLYHLSPEEIDEYWKERINVFSKNEKEILVEYLHIREQGEDAEFNEEYIQRALKIWV